MPSEKQVAANQQNAKKSTGPRTEEGKATVAKNALKHGLLSNSILMKGENAEAFSELNRQLYEELRPHGLLESVLVDLMVAWFWKMHRSLRIESEMMEDQLTRSSNMEISSTPTTLGSALFGDFANCDSFGKFVRYDTHAQRSFYKALHELRGLQATRNGQPAPPPVAGDADIEAQEEP